MFNFTCRNCGKCHHIKSLKTYYVGNDWAKSSEMVKKFNEKRVKGMEE